MNKMETLADSQKSYWMESIKICGQPSAAECK
jgi:hypothetical protein